MIWAARFILLACIASLVYAFMMGDWFAAKGYLLAITGWIAYLINY